MPELLVPVGNMENLKVAVYAGADAVYLGGKHFGARAYAENFSDEEMVKAIQFCHLYGVRIYVTLNTLIYESELPSAYAYAKFLHEAGVDALIMQDVGLIHLLRKQLPNLEIHASTQMHNIDNDTLKFLEDLGVKRVVLARELSLKQIKSLKTSLEKEVFIHGALCVCYSGQCLFSSVLLNRSGNRGECAQMCRLPYTLEKGHEKIPTSGPYLLSPKELNTLEHLSELIDAGITSLKIEGRMRSANYVYVVTRLYRELIDAYKQHQPLKPNPRLLTALETTFNREYTSGFLFGATDTAYINPLFSNHRGRLIGEVVKITKKRIYIKLSSDLYQGDGIRFAAQKEGLIVNYLYNTKDLLINQGHKGETVAIDNKVNLKNFDQVFQTTSALLTKEVANLPAKKIPLTMHFRAQKDTPITLQLQDGENQIVVSGAVPLAAISQPITLESVTKQLSKVGDSIFTLEKLTIDLADNLFINLKDLNSIRREGLEKLMTMRAKKARVVREVPYSLPEKKSSTKQNTLAVLCYTPAQVQAALAFPNIRIYVNSYSLYRSFASYPEVNYRSLRTGNDPHSVKRVLATTYGALSGAIADSFLNVTNHATIAYLRQFSPLITLSSELSFSEVQEITKHTSGADLEVIVYSRPELMITKYCPLKTFVNKEPICTVCQHDQYYLVDRNKARYPLVHDEAHITHILHHQVINNIAQIPKYLEANIQNFRLEFFNEDDETCTRLIQEALNLFEASGLTTPLEPHL